MVSAEGIGSFKVWDLAGLNGGSGGTIAVPAALAGKATFTGNTYYVDSLADLQAETVKKTVEKAKVWAEKGPQTMTMTIKNPDPKMLDLVTGGWSITSSSSYETPEVLPDNLPRQKLFELLGHKLNTRNTDGMPVEAVFKSCLCGWLGEDFVGHVSKEKQKESWPKKVTADGN